MLNLKAAVVGFIQIERELLQINFANKDTCPLVHLSLIQTSSKIFKLKCRVEYNWNAFRNLFLWPFQLFLKKETSPFIRKPCKVSYDWSKSVLFCSEPKSNDRSCCLNEGSLAKDCWRRQGVTFPKPKQTSKSKSVSVTVKSLSGRLTPRLSGLSKYQDKWQRINNSVLTVYRDLYFSCLRARHVIGCCTLIRSCLGSADIEQVKIFFMSNNSCFWSA